jgi:hypothetical protein
MNAAASAWKTFHACKGKNNVAIETLLKDLMKI